ncbi:SGNH/GDSL hydrolase family protein [Chryseotalea sanaruensis]|uniref:SGNH/GDSL hydrolase family protein n=1 Tax=Chryseotalea sanaruensis TaxID=2482724 RepID=UPI000F8C70CC|nr:SGNH/GDSL hydrolase family protein [Chryseotalea sanaruensis]
MKKILFLMLVSSAAVCQTLLIEEKVKFLALGDSYTIGQSVPVAERWPVQLIEHLKSDQKLTSDDPRIIATTGWRTDQLKAAILNAAITPGSYNLISLLIGVNNQYQGRSVNVYAQEFEELLQMAIDLAGNKERVFVVSIPDYGYTPFGESNQATISAQLDEFNRINKSITSSKGVLYINITDISRLGLQDPELVAGDRLHPSGKMYKAWVDRILSNDSIRFIKNTVTDVKKKKEEAMIRVFPNPIDNVINLDGKPNSSISFKLINIKGDIALHEHVRLPHTCSASTLSTGLYHYIIEDERGLVDWGKLVKY